MLPCKSHPLSGGNPRRFVQVQLCRSIQFVLFKRRENAQAALGTPEIIIGHVLLNHPGQLFPAGKTPAVITLTLKDSPKAFHGAIINALANTRHALDHACLRQLIVEHLRCVLDSPVAVKERIRPWVLRNCLVKSIIHQCAVVSVPNDKGYNPSVAEIQYGTEVNLVQHRTCGVRGICSAVRFPRRSSSPARPISRYFFTQVRTN